MYAEVISIGDEMTTGQRLDTNSQWLSQRLGEIGVRVLFHTTVGDELESHVQVYRQAFERADVVLSTGGLGPTADDLTRQALADVLGVDLVLDEPAWQHIQQLFAHRQREMPPRNVVQAMFPCGSRVIPNPHGTAPGIVAEIPRPGRSPVRVFALPGVPAEMREMWDQTVAPELLSALGGNRRIIRHRCLRCFGVGESDLERMLPDLIRRGRTPTVGITVNQATITLRITAEGESPQACFAAMEPTVATIRQCLGDLIFGQEEDELQHAVVRQLAKQGQTLATAEYKSGGLLAYWLSEADPAGGVYRGGSVVHDETVLARLAGLAPAAILAASKSTAEVVCGMAASCRELYQTDYALALGPFPSSDSATSRPGDVHYALAGPHGTEAKATLFAGHPDILRARTVKATLNFLRLKLKETERWI
ncbi:MAG: CinA family nicotinamide mononucleotide deamidase-related protein [Planctomycetota bacterium]|nr:CinA family nicotinamide mononucleotide deamidase-related protein [Planctomycetota bacterium]